MSLAHSASQAECGNHVCRKCSDCRLSLAPARLRCRPFTSPNSCRLITASNSHLTSAQSGACEAPAANHHTLSKTISRRAALVGGFAAAAGSMLDTRAAPAHAADVPPGDGEVADLEVILSFTLSPSSAMQSKCNTWQMVGCGASHLSKILLKRSHCALNCTPLSPQGCAALSYANREFGDAVSILNELVERQSDNPRWYEMRAQVGRFARVIQHPKRPVCIASDAAPDALAVLLQSLTSPAAACDVAWWLQHLL